MSITSVLFNKKEFDQVIREREESLIREASNFSETQLANTNDEVAESLLRKYAFIVPKIAEEEITVVNAGTQDTIYINGRTLSGTVVTYAIPFRGDGTLFEYRPSAGYTYNPPTGEVKRQEIHCTYFKSDSSVGADQIAGEFKSDLEKIKQYLGQLEHDVERFLTIIRPRLNSILEKRRKKFADDKELIEKLGYPPRRP